MPTRVHSGTLELSTAGAWFDLLPHGWQLQYGGRDAGNSDMIVRQEMSDSDYSPVNFHRVEATHGAAGYALRRLFIDWWWPC